MITELKMVVKAKSSDCWYDSCDTILVCDEKLLLKICVEIEETKEVMMGIANSAKLWRINPSELQLTFGRKLIFINIHHVPKIRKNMVSANFLCMKEVKAISICQVNLVKE